MLRWPGLPFKLAQGVTTVVVGNCGFSLVPPSRAFDAILGGGDGDWSDTAGYLDAIGRARPSVNVAALAGHNSIRLEAMGTLHRPPGTRELERMRGRVREAMDGGACGLSTGLIYTPGRFAHLAEIVELAAEVAPYHGLYVTHMRDEAFGLLDSVRETLEIGRQAGCAVHISHHKAAGAPNHGKVRDSLDLIDGDVTLDVYPYTAASSRLRAYLDIGVCDPAMRIASCPTFPRYDGWTLQEVADDMGCDVASAGDRLTDGDGTQTVAIYEAMCEQDVETNLRDPRVMIGSDGIPVLEGKPHPRLFGTFPRILARYVRERGVLTLEEAVRRMTSLPCRRFGLRDRGTVAPGMFADLVVFDPRTVSDTATYEDPMREPDGMVMVVVNGEVAYERGRHLEPGSGRMLRYEPNQFH